MNLTRLFKGLLPAMAVAALIGFAAVPAPTLCVVQQDPVTGLEPEAIRVAVSLERLPLLAFLIVAQNRFAPL